jgi:hypothetical protein
VQYMFDAVVGDFVHAGDRVDRLVDLLCRYVNVDMIVMASMDGHGKA